MGAPHSEIYNRTVCLNILCWPGLQRMGKIRGRLRMPMNLLNMGTFFLPLCAIEPKKWDGLTIKALAGLTLSL
jgi:hypothetical protein